jgi:hypothetical protein
MYSNIFQKILYFPSQQGFFLRNVFSENISILKNNIICAEATKVSQYIHGIWTLRIVFFCHFVKGIESLPKDDNGKGHAWYR